MNILVYDDNGDYDDDYEDDDDDDELFLQKSWPKNDVKPYFQVITLSEILTIANLWNVARRIWTCGEPELTTTPQCHKLPLTKKEAKPKNSSVADHFLFCPLPVSYGDFTILTRENKTLLLELKESLLIMRDKPTIFE